MLHFTYLTLKRDKPWLIIGKGPSFEKLKKIKIRDYYTFGLNHVCSVLRCDIGHFIDLDVLDSQFIINSHVVLGPWHPHINCKANEKTLLYHADTNGYVKEADETNKLYYYDLSTWKRESKEEPIIFTKYFSGEAAFRILGILGVRDVCSIGIDGGTKYAETFDKFKPLTNGQKSFDVQFKMIEQTIDKYQMRYKSL